MSKILILTGSPGKNGSTDNLAASFIRGAIAHNDIEVVSVSDYKVNPYIGCNYSFSRVKTEYFQTGEVGKIYEKLKKTDVLVINNSDKNSESDSHLKAIMNRFNRSSQKSFPLKKLNLMSEIKGRITEDDLKKAYELGKAI